VNKQVNSHSKSQNRQQQIATSTAVATLVETGTKCVIRKH